MCPILTAHFAVRVGILGAPGLDFETWETNALNSPCAPFMRSLIATWVGNHAPNPANCHPERSALFSGAKDLL